MQFNILDYLLDDIGNIDLTRSYVYVLHLWIFKTPTVFLGIFSSYFSLFYFLHIQHFYYKRP